MDPEIEKAKKLRLAKKQFSNVMREISKKLLDLKKLQDQRISDKKVHDINKKLNEYGN